MTNEKVLALAEKVLEDGVHDTAAACEDLAQGVLDLHVQIDSIMQLVCWYRRVAAEIATDVMAAFGRDAAAREIIRPVLEARQGQVAALEDRLESLPGWLCQGCGEWQRSSRETCLSDDGLHLCQACYDAAREEFGG